MCVVVTESVFERYIMKKILAVAFAFLFLSGCFEPQGLVGNEYQMVYSNDQFFPISIGFRRDESFYSNTINNIEGIYNINGNKITMQVTNKTNLVPDIQFVGIEENYIRSLPKVTGYQLTTDGMQLMTYDNQVLTFRRIGRAM